MGAFRGLRFLDVDCWEICPYPENDVLELACLAYTPWVSVYSTRHLSVTISTGSWKHLDLWSRDGAFLVAINDTQAFMRNTGEFSFTFPKRFKPDDLIEKLEKAGTSLGVSLEYTTFGMPSAEMLTINRRKPEEVD